MNSKWEGEKNLFSLKKGTRSGDLIEPNYKTLFSTQTPLNPTLQTFVGPLIFSLNVGQKSPFLFIRPQPNLNVLSGKTTSYFFSKFIRKTTKTLNGPQICLDNGTDLKTPQNVLQRFVETAI